VYAVTNDIDMSIVDVSNPQNPIVIGSFDENYSSYDIAESGNLIYLAEWTGLRILDVSIPTSPSSLGMSDFCCGSGMAVSGNYAYVANGGGAANRGLVIIDVSNSSAPSIVSTYPSQANFYDVAVSGNYAYVADQDSGMTVIDVTNPAAPTFVSRFMTPGIDRSVVVSGNLLFLGTGDPGMLYAFDISNPAVPALISSYSGGINPVDMKVDAKVKFLYTANGWYGGDIMVFNVSNPTAISMVGSYQTLHDCYGVAMSGDKLFFGDYHGLGVLSAFADLDVDGVNDFVDNCPGLANPDQADTDSDSVGDVCDNCPTVANPSQADADHDNIGDACDYKCGDANGDTAVDISDVVYLIAYIFSGGAPPKPLLAGDANCDHAVDISDVVYLISYIFSGGAKPCAACD
jgi:hypothetical protein